MLPFFFWGGGGNFLHFTFLAAHRGPSACTTRSDLDIKQKKSSSSLILFFFNRRNEEFTG